MSRFLFLFSGAGTEHRLIFRHNEQPQPHTEKTETAKSPEGMNTYEGLKQHKEALVKKMDDLAKDSTGTHKTNWAHYKRGFLEQFAKHEADYCRSCTQETFNVLKNVLADYQTKVETFAKNPEYTSGPARSIYKIGYRTWAIRLPNDEPVGLLFGADVTNLKNPEYNITTAQIQKMGSWGDRQKNGFTVTPDPEDPDRLIVQSDISFQYRLKNEAQTQIKPEKVDNHPVDAGEVVAQEGLPLEPADAFAPEGLPLEPGEAFAPEDRPYDEAAKEDMKKYFGKIEKLRNWINEYNPQVHAGEGDGTLVADYWEAVTDEIKMIEEARALWSISPEKNMEQDRLKFLKDELTDHKKAESVNKQKSAERKEIRKAQDTALVNAMKYDIEFMINLADDSLIAESVLNEVNSFEKTHYLSDASRALGEKVLKLQDLHEWMKREEPRGWTNGDGMDWTFKSEREVTSGNSDDLTNSIGARVRVALTNGSLSQADLNQYMTNVLKWTNKKKETFRKALEEKLPGAKERPGKAPEVIPAPDRTKKSQPKKEVPVDESSPPLAPEEAFAPEPEQVEKRAKNFRTLNKVINNKGTATFDRKNEVWEFKDEEFRPYEQQTKEVFDVDAFDALTEEDIQDYVDTIFHESSKEERAILVDETQLRMSDQKKNLRLLISKALSGGGIMQTPYFSDDEKKIVKTYDKNTEKPGAITKELVTIAKKARSILPFHEWVTKMDPVLKDGKYVWNAPENGSPIAMENLERARQVLAHALERGETTEQEIKEYLTKVLKAPSAERELLIVREKLAK